MRCYSSTKEPLDVQALLSIPSWSVRSLLPDPSIPPKQEVTPKQLHHLLRLSALPQPKSPEEEAEMLKTLHSQLHFVRDVQSVDTEGVEPLQSIRDETEEGIKEATIRLDDLKDAFAQEEIVGRNRRPRRKRGEPVDAKGAEDWDALSTASEKFETPAGNYFIVRSGKE
jgi:Asp-tRNA(Asn)/Glu-tRNA(Gln) amidotransferase C subunit